MNWLKRLCLAIALTLVGALSVVAGEVQSPPCAQPDPGEVQSPPCSTAQLTSDAPSLCQTLTPSSTSAVTDYVVADTAIDFVECVLSLF